MAVAQCKHVPRGNVRKSLASLQTRDDRSVRGFTFWEYVKVETGEAWKRRKSFRASASMGTSWGAKW